VRHNLFLAVKEALNNVVKHAHARVVWLRLVEQPHGFHLVIEDDGRGFVPDAGPPPAQAERGTPGQGLGNLRARLAAIGGCCTVASVPGQGTRVELAVEGLLGHQDWRLPRPAHPP
jgi:signal transduction histidine kinase